jgi:hypothetical protein
MAALARHDMFYETYHLKGEGFLPKVGGIPKGDK